MDNGTLKKANELKGRLDVLKSYRNIEEKNDRTRIEISTQTFSIDCSVNHWSRVITDTKIQEKLVRYFKQLINEEISELEKELAELGNTKSATYVLKDKIFGSNKMCCSCCGEELYSVNKFYKLQPDKRYKYCQNCGAKMEEIGVQGYGQKNSKRDIKIRGIGR